MGHTAIPGQNSMCKGPGVGIEYRQASPESGEQGEELLLEGTKMRLSGTCRVLI